MPLSPQNNGAERIEKHGPEPCPPIPKSSSRRIFLNTIKKALFVAAARELIRTGLNKILDLSDCQDGGDVNIEERTEFFEDVEDIKELDADE